MILLRSFKRTLFIACGIITATTCAMAQTTPVNTQLLLANPAANDDFLLPSMLNASATQTAPNEIQAPSDVDILTAIFGSGGEKNQANSSFSHTFLC